ncbi:MAG: transposase [Acidobacteria bacterium]|nr:transposase [Acidobacteriota bacterium]
MERFNRTYREAVLDMYIFESLSDVRSQTERWLEIYNHHRPHDSLGGAPPSESNGPVLINPNTPV